MMRIGIDIMGSDFAPEVPIQGVLLAKKEIDPSIEIVLLGQKDAIIGNGPPLGRCTECPSHFRPGPLRQGLPYGSDVVCAQTSVAG